MRHTLVVVLVLALTAPMAHADPEQDKWRAAFAASVMVTATGTTMLLWGRSRIDTAEHALCTGDYVDDCGHGPPSTAAEVNEFNEKGQKGETFARVGLGVMVAGLVLTGVTAYKGFGPSKHEQTVAVTPAVTPHSAGAALTLRW